MARAPVSSNTAFAGLAFSLIVPSLASVQKVAGNAGTAAYVAVALGALWVVQRHLRGAIASRLTEPRALALAALTGLGLFALFLVVYPMANSGRFGGGTDGDEALNIATLELLHGHYPYYPRTYLGNQISPMPGALLLAVPFVLLGNGAHQNLFWLALFFFAMKRTCTCWAATSIPT